MILEDEAFGIRRRRAELERALLGIQGDTLAITLIKVVIEDMDARLAALATARPPSSEDEPSSAGAATGPSEPKRW
jgi:hypothetical protein